MRAELSKRFIKGIYLSAVIFIFLLFGIVTGYKPIFGILIILALVYLALFYHHPPRFAYLYVFTLSFARLLNLPITQGGFSAATAIALCSFVLCLFGYLVRKDRDLISILTNRIDQAMPILFLIAMVLSLMNSRAIAISIVQIQQFLYQVVVYYFLHLIIREKYILRKAVLILLIGGSIVAVLGLIEAVFHTPFYFLLGRQPRSLFGATLDLKQAITTIQGYVGKGIEIGKGRIIGLIGDGPLHGIYMVVVAVFSVFFLQATKKPIVRILCGFSFLISIFNILGSGSRAAFVSLIIALFIYLYLMDIPHKTAVVISSISIIVLLTLIMVVFIPSIRTTRSFTYSDDSAATAEMRYEHIPVSLMMFGDHPIFGQGPDGFLINYKHYAAGITNHASRIKNLRSHNTPLQVLAEYGMVGFIILFMTIIC